ncbi:MAG: ABC transporter substrate-binding protein [Hydrogenophaga sp.]|uniref:ABC transporter substrate-binding protein n=1 Tax=Hydrogenophaga sp. TaxID=1904254 RepID=UPI0027232267|nr:ABC transporter substrate-binding protein [Hydrogenophaga sp.]MDO9568572.1 ABC transporter substrate-binding protein [Hydrogenophaga sp.]MDP3375702.1 ABC transporter substrate-binding protein [Hydrogenophaga sp.]
MHRSPTPWHSFRSQAVRRTKLGHSFCLLSWVLCAWAAQPALADDYQGPELKGETLTISCPWTGAEGDNFRSVTALFERRTGAVVHHACSQSSEQAILANAKSGTSTNISVIPQPGLAAQLASMGAMVPLGAKTQAWMERAYAAGQSWAELGQFSNAQGKKELYGLAFNVNVKSLVWYIPKRFEEKGYKAPQSMEQLEALTQRMVKDGVTPWCIGLESEAASGWPATDWVEDMMLRLHPTSVYDDWVTNRIPFNDPRVLEAIKAYGKIATDPALVAGGPKAVNSTSFKESPRGLFGNQPACYMHRQASFISSFFPERQAQEADFFYFPSYVKKMLGFPVLGGGTLFTITQDSKAARAFMAFLQHPQAHETWMERGGFLTPHRAADRRKYRDRLQRKAGDILLGATTIRFDGSDLMPAAVGAGTFWKGMLDYTGGKNLEVVTADIDKSWKALK